MSKKNIRRKKDVEVEQYDILQLDEKIRKMIQEESKQIEAYKKRLDEIEDILNKNSGIIPLAYRLRKELENEQKELKNKIIDIENNNMLAEYVCISQKIISEYLQLIMVPVKVSFFSKSKENTETDEKKGDLLDQFLEIAKKYVPIRAHKKESIRKISCTCGNNNSNEFKQTEDFLICEDCGLEKMMYTIQTNFKDIDRVNMSQKYKYKRKVHFRDTVNQYQGKQNKKFSPKMYKDVDEWFEKHNLLVDSEIFYEKHKNITKEHLSMALTETGHNKHYEDINLIFNYFTGIACPDISDVENDLFDDFDKVVDIYESLDGIDRTNFLNNQYILYQLLRRRKVKVKESDFDILKTRDRLIEHDSIFERICIHLEWSFSSTT